MNLRIAIATTSAAIILTATCLAESNAGASNSVINPPAPAAAGSTGADAAEGPGELVSDRPDFTESSEVVGRGMMQIETGVVTERARQDGERSLALTGPLPLVRIGLSRRLELRLSGDGYQWQRALPAGEKLRGASDGALGAKYKIAGEKGWRPAVAVIGALSAPFGHRDLTSGGWDPEVKLCWAKEAPKGVAVSGNFNFASVSDPDGRLFNRALSLSAGHDLPFGMGGYFEWYDISLDRGLGHASVLNGGITRMIGKDTQIDAEIGHTISGTAPGWFVSLGLVVRRPLGLLVR